MAIGDDSLASAGLQSAHVNCVTGMFLEKKAFSGDADKMTIDEFVEDWEHLKFQPPLCNYAQLLPRDT